MSDQDTWHDYNITQALGAFQPQPSARFFQRMQRQPWMKESMTTLTHVVPKRKTDRRWMPAAGLLAMLLIAGTVFVTPPLRALAQEMLAWVVRAPSDTMTNRELDANVPPIEAYRFNLTLAEAEQLVGFDAWELPTVPNGFQLQQIGAIPVEQMIVFSYATAPFTDNPNEGLPPSFVLMQQPAARAASSMVRFPVGASAVIKTVQIGDVTGQYIGGSGWCGANSDSETQMQWCPNSGERMLRWQRGDWVFMLGASDRADPYKEEPSLTREQMIELAANLVPPQE